MALYVRYGQILRLYSRSNILQRFSSTCASERKGLVLGAYSSEDNTDILLTQSAEKFNKISQGKLLEHLKLAGGTVKPGKSVIFWGLDKEYQAVAVVGLENKCSPDDHIELICQEKENIRAAAAAGCKALDAVNVKDIRVENFSDAESAAEGSFLSSWKFQEYKTKKSILPTIQPYDFADNEFNKWCRGVKKAEAQNLARKLSDTPSNLLTPSIFAQEAEKLLTPLGIDVVIHDKKWAEDEKMALFLSVAKGSIEPPKFLEISYSRGNGNPFVLVGKGVTFDSGGISLKPSAKMDEMRADMGGAACVLATLYGLAQMNIETNVKILIPLVENLPSGSAVKPGDVLYGRNGKSVCVDNTDAEGRLILADALSYSSQLNPKWVLDIATLTGAMRVALGNGATGTFTNSDKLYTILQNAGSKTGDRVWRMPLWKHYTKQVAQNTAYDLNNIGKPSGGGSCTAAAFLREFVPKNTEWLHLDIAGVMGPDDNTPYLSKGMTGRPTRTLIEFIESQSLN